MTIFELNNFALFDSQSVRCGRVKSPLFIINTHASQIRAVMQILDVTNINAALCIDGPNFLEVPIDDPDDIFSTPVPPWNYGTKGLTTNSPLQREIARKNAIKRNENQKGANNRNAKTWRVVYTDGRELIVKGLQAWAVENGYSRAGIKNIAYGKWKRYRDLVTVEEVTTKPATDASGASY